MQNGRVWLVPRFTEVDDDVEPFIVLCCKVIKDPFVNEAAVDAY